ncbi:MAG TPA: tripartite tricarboxylate transporter TctB family protein [bacterium]|nr:tripartite tricarboxylate transporter TctB family protein [bacterium]
MQTNKLFDFMASCVMIALGIYVFFAGVAINKDVGGIYYDGPGFLPIILGVALTGCSLLLLFASLKDGGLDARMAEMRVWGREKAHSKDTAISLIGMAIMFIYSFVLFKLLPFWISSFIFLVGIMAYLKATRLLRGLLISACTVAVIVVFFQVGFRVQLP